LTCYSYAVSVYRTVVVRLSSVRPSVTDVLWLNGVRYCLGCYCSLITSRILAFMTWKSLTLDDLEGQYCNRNYIGCSAFSLAAFSWVFLFYDLFCVTLFCRGKFVAPGKFFPPPCCHNVTKANPNFNPNLNSSPNPNPNHNLTPNPNPKFNPILNLNPNPYCCVWE